MRRTSLEEKILTYSIPEPNSGCWLWLGSVSTSGYGRVTHRAMGGALQAHRASWMVFRGKILDGLFVLHKCDVRPCVNPDHLFLGTHQDNMRDMVSKGRSKPGYVWGDTVGTSRLTKEQVYYILSSPLNQHAIARELGVWQTTISRIRAGHTWAKIGKPSRPSWKTGKLSEDAVREIRASELSIDVLAERYGVHRVSIWRVKAGKQWSNIA